MGGHETLLDDSQRLADKARDAGVDVELEVFPEMQHVFQVSVGTVPEATEAVAKMTAWLPPPPRPRGRIGRGLTLRVGTKQGLPSARQRGFMSRA